MTKKMRRVRTFARTATKSQEKHLIDNAKKLHENPYVVLPECTDNSCEKYFIKIRKRLEKIQQRLYREIRIRIKKSRTFFA